MLLIKEEIRKTILEKVNDITDRSKRSFSMKDELLKVLSSYQRIALFVSLDNEIDTVPLIEALLELGKDIYLPRTNGIDMDFYQVTDLSHLEISKDNYKVREPVGGMPIDPNSLEVIVCPGVAFDKNNNRMGHGKGYYDRYLARTNAYKIGVCYKEQLLDEIPIDKYDIKMDKVFIY